MYKIDYENHLFILFLFFGCVGSSVRARAFSSCGKRGPLFIAVRGPFTIAAPPVAGHRLQTRRLSIYGSRAQLLHGMWDLPRPGLEPVSPALAGRFSTTAPPGKPWLWKSYTYNHALSHCGWTHSDQMKWLVKTLKIKLQLTSYL